MNSGGAGAYLAGDQHVVRVHERKTATVTDRPKPSYTNGTATTDALELGCCSRGKTASTLHSRKLSTPAPRGSPGATDPLPASSPAVGPLLTDITAVDRLVIIRGGIACPFQFVSAVAKRAGLARRTLDAGTSPSLICSGRLTTTFHFKRRAFSGHYRGRVLRE